MERKVVVIGAGLAGVQTAWFLRREGLDVTVIDRRDGPALETSFANGGLITPSHAAPWNSPGIFRTMLSSIGDESSAIYVKAEAVPQYLRWGLRFVRNSTPSRFRQTIQRNARLARYSLAQFNALTEELGLCFDGDRRGTMMIHRSQPALDRAKVANEAVAASGVHVVSCTAADLIRIEPALAPVSETLSGGFYYPNDQHGDPHLFCKGLADRLAAEGVDLRFGETAGTIETSGSRATGVVTDKGRHPADAVVLAAGFWSAEIGKQLGLRLPIKPVKGYSITYDVDGCDGLPKIPVVDDEMHIGLTPLGKRMRIVGTAEFSGYSPEINPARIDNLRRVAQATYPALSRVLIENEPLSMWCGHRPMTPDCLPIFGKRGLENLFLNTGHGYLGWTTACGTSRAVSDLIVGRNPSEEVTGLGADRF